MDQSSPTAQTISIQDLQPKNLVIHGSSAEALVTISLKDGSLTFGPNYAPDKAARIFWEAVSFEHRSMMELRAEVASLKSFKQAVLDPENQVVGQFEIVS